MDRLRHGFNISGSLYKVLAANNQSGGFQEKESSLSHRVKTHMKGFESTREMHLRQSILNISLSRWNTEEKAPCPDFHGEANSQTRKRSMSISQIRTAFSVNVGKNTPSNWSAIFKWDSFSIPFWRILDSCLKSISKCLIWGCQKMRRKSLLKLAVTR